MLTGTVTIAKDADVEIAPGAKITCAEGATLYVQEVRARAAASHAQDHVRQWAGLVVSGGGLRRSRGCRARERARRHRDRDGAQESRFTEGAILNSLKPFVVSDGSKLT